jgi:hypothetical protein
MARPARRLLALYPRAWRERYGEEFMELLGEEPVGFAQVINIVSGAIDARVSPEVRGSTAIRKSALVSQGGSTNMTVLKYLCAHEKKSPFTVRDSIIGAGALILTSFALAFGGAYVRRHGYPDLGEFMKGVAFPISLIAWMNFTYMKGQSRAARGVILGGTLAFIVMIGWLSVKI